MRWSGEEAYASVSASGLEVCLELGSVVHPVSSTGQALNGADVEWASSLDGVQDAGGGVGGGTRGYEQGVPSGDYVPCAEVFEDYAWEWSEVGGVQVE